MMNNYSTPTDPALSGVFRNTAIEISFDEIERSWQR